MNGRKKKGNWGVDKIDFLSCRGKFRHIPYGMTGEIDEIPVDRERLLNLGKVDRGKGWLNFKRSWLDKRRENKRRQTVETKKGQQKMKLGKNK